MTFGEWFKTLEEDDIERIWSMFLRMGVIGHGRIYEEVRAATMFLCVAGSRLMEQSKEEACRDFSEAYDAIPLKFIEMWRDNGRHPDDVPGKQQKGKRARRLPAIKLLTGPEEPTP